MSGCRQRFFEPLYAVTQQNKVCALKRDGRSRDREQYPHQPRSTLWSFFGQFHFLAFGNPIGTRSVRAAASIVVKLKTVNSSLLR